MLNARYPPQYFGKTYKIQTKQMKTNGYVSFNKLYAISREIKHARRIIENPEVKRKLKHYDKFINNILENGGDNIFLYIENAIKNEREK